MLPHDQGEGINKETGRQAWSIGPDLVFVFYPDNILSRRKFLSHKLHNGCNLDSLLLESLWDGTPRKGVQKKSEEEKIDKYLSALSRYCVQVVILFVEIVYSGLELNSGIKFS